MTYLTDRIDIIFDYIESKRDYLENNYELFDIYSGNLKPYVEKIMIESLSENYFKKVKSRIMPVNILKRLIDKLSKCYSTAPIRESSNMQEFIDHYVEEFNLDLSMNTADEFSNLFKGYALEPYVKDGKSCLRVLPYDRFLVYSDDPSNPLNVTVFIKIMGKKLIKNYKNGSLESRTIYYLYTNDEFLAIDSKKEIYSPAMQDNQGINPYGIIPIYYANRSKYSILPIQDTDLSAMVKLIPTMLSDLGGAIMFQCFSIIYGIDINFEDLTFSPNSLWSFKSDKVSQKEPKIGTIKPEANIGEVMSFIKEALAIWIESRGIKAGSVGSIDAQNFASGIAKIIDEMDTYELRKVAIQSFKVEEFEFFKMLQVMHNYWVQTGKILNQRQYVGDLEFSIEYDEPVPYQTKTEQLDSIERELKLGTMDFETAIKELHPDWSEEKIEELVAAKQKPIEIKVSEDGMAASGDTNTKGSETETTRSDSVGSY